MVEVNKVKKRVDLILNKEQSGGYSIDQFNTACEMANQDLFRARYGLTQEYAPGRPSPRVAYEVTQKVKDDLRVFKETVVLQSIDGSFDIPEGYVHMTSLMIALNSGSCSDVFNLGRPIDLLTDSELGERLADNLTAPSEKHPAAVLDNTKINVFPKSILSVSLTYLREPVIPVWGYTIVDDIAIYDQEESTDFEWPTILTNDISAMVVGYLGVNIRDQEVVGYSDKAIQRGV